MAEEMTIESLQADLAGARARIAEVNTEAAGHRVNAANARKGQETAEVAKAAAETAAAERIKQIETDAGEKLSRAQQIAVRANLRVAAKEAGASDPNDMLALIPAEKLKVGEDGEIENAAELMAALKKAKPYLFGATSTSNPQQTPSADPPAPKKAMEMPKAEYEASRAALTKR